MSHDVSIGMRAEFVDSLDSPHFLTQVEEMRDEDGRVVGQRVRYYVERARLEILKDGRVTMVKVSGEPLQVGLVSHD